MEAEEMEKRIKTLNAIRENVRDMIIKYNDIINSPSYSEGEKSEARKNHSICASILIDIDLIINHIINTDVNKLRSIMNAFCSSMYKSS